MFELPLATGSTAEESLGGAVDEAGSCVLKLKGLPFTTTEEQIRAFFEPAVQPQTVQFVLEPDGRASGLAFADFTTREEARRALTRNGEYIGDRYVRLLSVPRAEMEEQVRMGTLAIPGTAAKLQARMQQAQQPRPGLTYLTSGPQLLVPSQMLHHQATVGRSVVPVSMARPPGPNAQVIGPYPGMDSRLWHFPGGPGGLHGGLTHGPGLHTGMGMLRPPPGPPMLPAHLLNTSAPPMAGGSGVNPCMGRGPLFMMNGGQGHPGAAPPLPHLAIARPGPMGGGGGKNSRVALGLGAGQGMGHGLGPPIPPSSTTIKMRGLPYRCSPADILAFFVGFQYLPDSLQIGLDSLGRPSGEAWLTFNNQVEAHRAVNKLNRQYLGNRYLELQLC